MFFEKMSVCSFVRSLVRPLVRSFVRPANWRKRNMPFLGFYKNILKGFRMLTEGDFGFSRPFFNGCLL